MTTAWPDDHGIDPERDPDHGLARHGRVDSHLDDDLDVDLDDDLADELDRELLEQQLAWEAAEREAAEVLQVALTGHLDADLDAGELELAAARLRHSLAAGDPRANWLSHAAGLAAADGDLAGLDDLGLVWELTTATFAPEDDPRLPIEQQASLAGLTMADWIGAVIGLVRAGPGSPVDTGTVLGYIRTCPEIDDAPLDDHDEQMITAGFDIVLPAWQVAGMIDRRGSLTDLGAWLLPRALAVAWGLDLDADHDAARN